MTSVRPHTGGISHTSVVSRIAVAIWFAAFPAVLFGILANLKGGALGGRAFDWPVRGQIGLVAGFAAAGAWLGPLILRETAEEADAWRIGVWIGALAGLVLPAVVYLPQASIEQFFAVLIGFVWLDVPAAVLGAFAGWTLFLLMGAPGPHSERRS